MENKINRCSTALKLLLATHDDMLLQTTDNTQAESFQIGESDELADEMMESRKNVTLMKFLDQRSERAKGRRGTRLAEIRQKLHL